MFTQTTSPFFETVAPTGRPQPVKEQEIAKKRISGEGTVWYVASEKRYRAQYPAGGKNGYLAFSGLTDDERSESLVGRRYEKL